MHAARLISLLLAGCGVACGLVCVPAQAAKVPATAHWSRIARVDGGVFYLDKGHAVREDQGRKAWSLQSFRQSQATPDGKLYRSFRALHLYSCASTTVTLREQIFYPEAMGRGEPVASYKFEKFSPEEIAPGSPYERARKTLCRRRR